MKSSYLAKQNQGKLAKLNNIYKGELRNCAWSSVLNKNGHICMNLPLFCVVGYLSDEGYVNSYKCFIKECPHLNEYLTLKRRGQTYPLHVNGLTLCQTLQEYAHFKLAGKYD